MSNQNMNEEKPFFELEVSSNEGDTDECGIPKVKKFFWNRIKRFFSQLFNDNEKYQESNVSFPIEESLLSHKREQPYRSLMSFRLGYGSSFDLDHLDAAADTHYAEKAKDLPL